VEGEALKVIVELTLCPALKVTGLRSKVAVSPAGRIAGGSRLMVPANPLILDRVTVAVPIPPEMKDSVGGGIVKPKSATTTVRVT